MLRSAMHTHQRLQHLSAVALDCVVAARKHATHAALHIDAYTHGMKMTLRHRQDVVSKAEETLQLASIAASDVNELVNDLVADEAPRCLAHT